MVKLLELVKSYDELKTQAPAPEAKEALPKKHATTPASEEDPESDPVISAARDLDLISYSPHLHPPPPEPVELAREPEEPATSSAFGAEAGEELYDRVIDQVSQLFEAAAMETISPGRLVDEAAKTEEMAAELAIAPRVNEDLIVRALGTYPDGKGFVAPHSANVAVLAAYVGHEFGLSPVRLTDTCLAGLTHDIGNVQLSSGILYKTGPPSPKEWDELRERPEYSREILESLGDRYGTAAGIVHQVYERLDGSGYPRGIEGDQILTEARILGAVDFFETVIHPRPYKDTLAGDVSYGLQTLMRMAGQFGRDTLKALVRSVGLFPVGTYVRLSTGEIGRVLSTSKRNPMRPVVEVILDKRKRRARMPRKIDLVQAPHLYVSKPLSGSDVVDLGLLDPSEKVNGAGANGLSGGGAFAEPDLRSDSRDEPSSSVPE